jgi:hypothetical protein
MQRFASTIGIFSEAGLSAVCGIIVIAAVGHLRAQRSQAALSALTTHKSPVHTAVPICVADFSAVVMARSAPVGQTSEHLTHSGRQ